MILYLVLVIIFFFFFSSRRRHTRYWRDWSSDVCSSDLSEAVALYRDDFLAGFALRDSAAFDDWQFFQGEELRRELAGALERLGRGVEIGRAAGWGRV